MTGKIDYSDQYHKIDTVIKNACAKIVKEITGSDIKKVIPEGSNRLKLYQVYQKAWNETQNYHNAENATKKWIREWEKAKSAVKLTFKAIHGKDIKECINDAVLRSTYYEAIINNNEKEAIEMIKKFAS
jgi:hypothetical protein